LLVPSVAAGAARETDDLRAACFAVVTALLPYDVVCVGTEQAVGIGAWLLPSARQVVVPRDLSPALAAALGETLARDDVALLVMGDGSARRSPAAPGYFDERAEPYDAHVARALRDADPEALLAIDPAADDALLVAGRAAWQVLAGAARGRTFTGDLRYDAAPYGVGYFVAVWT
jgi:hypothetical protein